MKKRIFSILIALLLLCSMFPVTALAEDALDYTERIALSTPTHMSSGKHEKGSTVVYYGGIPWILLTMDYNKDGTADDPLLLSEFVYGYGTPWMAYYLDTDTDAADDPKNGYLASDIRGYLNGSNTASYGGNDAADTFTAFRPVGAYGNNCDQYGYYRYWIRHKVNTDEVTIPAEGQTYYVKAAVEPTYQSVGYLKEAAFAVLDLYTKSGDMYTKAESYVSGTTYYYETTPYVRADVSDGFDEAKDYYTFEKANKTMGFVQVGDPFIDSTRNCAKAYYYCGYAVTTLDSQDDSCIQIVVAGDATESKTFAADLGLTAADLAAVTKVTAAGRGIDDRYTLQNSVSISPMDYYGGALYNDTFFLLSAEEANTLFGDDPQYVNEVRRWAKYGSAGGPDASWWLRSSYSETAACVVSKNGMFANIYRASPVIGIRPAFNLNLTAVMFTSAASTTSGKDTAAVGSGKFVQLAGSDDKDLKLTLKDENNFAVSADQFRKNTDGSFTVVYSGAKLAKDSAGKDFANVYVSAIITDSTDGETVYGYTKLAAVTEDNQSGTVNFTLPAGINADDIEEGKYVVKLFEEQCGDASKADYASVPTAMTVDFHNLSIASIESVTLAEPGKTFKAGTDGIANTDLIVTAKYSNGCVLTLAPEDFEIIKPENYDTVFHIQNAPLTAASQTQTLTVRSLEDNAKTANFDVTVIGIGQEAPVIGVSQNGARWDLTDMTTAMEYNTTSASADAESWTAYSTPITDASTVYFVRYKAHDDYAPGAVRIVIVPAASASVYTVKWYSDTGILLKTEQLNYGATPDYGTAPTKESDAQYSYTFRAWSPAIVSVNSDAEYYATYDKTLNRYTVTWKNGSTTLETDTNVPYGSIPSFDSAVPTKTGTAGTDYAFIGWSPAMVAVTGDVTYTAQFLAVKAGLNANEVKDIVEQALNDAGLTDMLTAEEIRVIVNDAVKKIRVSGGSGISSSEVKKIVEEAIEKALAEAGKEQGTAVNPFRDVEKTDYFYDAVLWAVGNKVTQGTDARHFSPFAPVTRAQALTFLWRTAGCPKAKTALRFSDVAEDAYYAEAVRWAVGQGITKGVTETVFKPDDTCTRAQIVTFLYRYSKDRAVSSFNPFTDVQPNAYYYDAVLWAVANDITGGTTAATFSPANTCSRAQVVSFLWRYVDR